MAAFATRTILSPYRICPLGAHVDHQGGKVLGTAINRYTKLRFQPHNAPHVELHSDNFNTSATFTLAAAATHDNTHWSRYAAAAAWALNQHTPIIHGIIGKVNGELLGGGVSSSASVGLAYLKALANANHIALTPTDLVELDRRIENDYLGLQNGILDPAMIVYSQPDALTYIDTLSHTVQYIKHPPTVGEVCWLVMYSGFSRELTATDFNNRVTECSEAARLLDSNATILSDVSATVFEQKKLQLPPHLSRRAAHYFTEQARVEAGATAWATGDFKIFGELMRASCDSSINQYECGSEPLIDLHQLLCENAAVFGSRFSGGGYGGCVVALVKRTQVEHIAQTTLNNYLSKYPEKRHAARAYPAESEGGIRFVSS